MKFTPFNVQGISALGSQHKVVAFLRHYVANVALLTEMSLSFCPTSNHMDSVVRLAPHTSWACDYSLREIGGHS